MSKLHTGPNQTKSPQPRRNKDRSARQARRINRKGK